VPFRFYRIAHSFINAPLRDDFLLCVYIQMSDVMRVDWHLSIVLPSFTIALLCPILIIFSVIFSLLRSPCCTAARTSAETRPQPRPATHRQRAKRAALSTWCWRWSLCRSTVTPRGTLAEANRLKFIIVYCSKNECITLYKEERQG
jgi:hypothetical protein